VIADVMARLSASCPSIPSVASAEELDALDRGTAPASGATFVIPFGEAAEANALMAGGFRQLVETQVLVAFLIRRHGDAKGGKRVADFDTLKAEIEQALAGWIAPTAIEPFELVSGRGAPRGNGVTIYVQTWKTSRYLRSP
jgi:hypothetical protein